MKHEGTERAFIWSSKTWYAVAADCRHEITFGMYDDEGGTSGEMIMKWHHLGDKWHPRLEVFHDAWDALYGFGNLLEAMAAVDGQSITEEGFLEMLKAHGFKDITQYDSPYNKTG